MKDIFFSVLLSFGLTVLSVPAAHAQTPQETLKQYVSDLQKNPSDSALREKIIVHVQTMRPAPAIPEEARKYINRGMAAAEDAKNEKDYRDAADEFQRAVNLAPWLGSGYRGLAVTQDKSGQYPQALQNLKFFLLTKPPEADAEAARTLRDKIEYRMEKAAKESSPEAIAEKQQNKADEFLRSLNGVRYVRPWQDICSGYTLSVDINGNEVSVGETQNWKSDPGCNNESVGPYYLRFRCRIVSKKMQGDDFVFEFDNSDNNWMYKSIAVSGSGNSLTLHDNYGNRMDYTRQR